MADLNKFFENVDGTRTLEVPAGENIFQQGEPILHFHIPVEGMAKLGWYHQSANRLFAIKVPGEILETQTYSATTTRGYFSTAITDLTMLVVGKEEFLQRIQNDYQLSKEIFSQLETDLSYQKKLKTIETVATNEVKLALLLDYIAGKINSCEEIRGKIQPDTIPLNQQELADFLTVNRVTISKYIRSLTQKGAVKTQCGELKVVHREILQKQFEQYI